MKWIATLALPLLAGATGVGIWFAASLLIKAAPSLLPDVLWMPSIMMLTALTSGVIAWLLGFWRWGAFARLYAGFISLFVGLASQVTAIVFSCTFGPGCD